MTSIVPLVRQAILGLSVLFFIGNGAFAQTDESLVGGFSCETINAENQYLRSLQDGVSGGDSFSSVYAQVQTEYHASVNEQFNAQISELMPQTNTKMCTPLPTDTSNTSLIISEEMKQELYKYECALRYYIANPQISGDEQTLMQGIQTLQNIESQLNEEIIKSYTSLQTTLQLYAEMRMWYTVHRDLQCLMSELTAYKDALREFVDEIVFMPIKFYNYSSTKQE